MGNFKQEIGIIFQSQEKHHLFVYNMYELHTFFMDLCNPLSDPLFKTMDIMMMDIEFHCALQIFTASLQSLDVLHVPL